MLHVRNLRVSFGPQEILKSISLDLNPGEVLAITGPNGSGKTTLLNCITGLLTPSSGTIQKKKEFSLSFLQQEGPKGNLLIKEYLLSDFPNIQEVHQKIQNSDPESKYYAYSITEYMDVGGFELDTKINKLIPHFQFTEKDLLRKMESFSEGEKQIWSIIKLLLKEADLFILDEPMNHLDISMCIYLEDLIQGEKMIEKLRKEKPFIEKEIRLSFPSYNVSNRGMLSAHNLSKKFEDNLIFQNVNLKLNTKDRIAIIGVNGCGKTTLIHCLLGYIQPDKGSVYRNDNVRWIYIPQNIRNYFKKEILLDNLMGYELEESVVRQFLGAAKLRREKVLQPISTLSEGELMRAAIVSTILTKAEFLFLDEPTNHLDIESLEVLDQLLDEFPGGMLFVSHDRYFITKHAQDMFLIKEKTFIPSYL
ncbi:MAG: ATP-binding cassette domain-containing protein [Actinomycetota bacterium]